MKTNHKQPPVNLSNPFCTALFAVFVLVLPISGLALADNIFVANGGNYTIEKFDSSGHGSIFANSGLSGPTYIAIQTPEPATLLLLTLGGLTVLRKR